MVKSHAAPTATPPSLHGGNTSHPKSEAGQRQFISMALNMTWQLAIVVLLPVIAGVQLDKSFGTSFVCTFIGLGVALFGSGWVMWRTMQSANKLPVPKLTAAEKREVQKRYEEEDADA